MQKPASGNVRPMMRSAVLPMVSISSEGEKRLSSVPGMISKNARPTHMMAMAVTAERRIVLRKRSGLPAP